MSNATRAIDRPTAEREPLERLWMEQGEDIPIERHQNLTAGQHGGTASN